MEKKEYEKLLESLLKREYRKFVQRLNHEDYMLSKGFHKEDNVYDNGRTALCVRLYIYDHTLHPEYEGRLPDFELSRVGIEVEIDVSRTIDERITMKLMWYDDTTIEDIEEKAEEFYKFVREQWPTPRKY